MADNLIDRVKDNIQTISFIGNITEQTISNIGQIPPYRHNNIANMKEGLCVAQKMVNNYLTRVSAKARQEIRSQINDLNRQQQELEKKFGPVSNLVQILNNSRLTDISQILTQLKFTTAGIAHVKNKLKLAKADGVKLGKEYFTISELDNLKESMRQKAYALYQDALKQGLITEEEVQKFFTKGVRGPARLKLDSTSSFQRKIGSLLEMESTRREIEYNQYILRITNLSESFKRDEREEYYNKADTLFEFLDKNTKKVFFSFTTSDKTGGILKEQTIITNANKTDLDLDLIPTFTGSINNALTTQSIGRIVAEGDKDFQAASNYIGMNADLKTMSASEVEEYRKPVLAVVLWSSLVVHVTGLLKPDKKTRTQNLPLFIRHFDRYYLTKEILDNILQQTDLGIFNNKFVATQYLQSWLNPSGINLNSPLLYNLFMAKNRALDKPTEVDYDTLYADADVNQALSDLYQVLKSQIVLNVSLRIKLDTTMKK